MESNHRAVMRCGSFILLLVAPVTAGDGITLAPKLAALDAGSTRVNLVSQYEQPGAPAPEPSNKPFGTAGSEWVTFGGGVAHDLSDATDANFHINFSRFFVDDVEFVAEVAAWTFTQRGDDAAGLSASMFFRWHFVNEEWFSLFVDCGIGMMVADNVVPEMGTGVNFMPRVGGGATFALGDAGARLITGLRWHHISNARIHGEERNPSRDAPMLYVGIMIPW